MATDMSAPRSAQRTQPIPVRKITDEDLRWSLRQGLDDFRDLRGDIVFAGLIYTLIGIAAVVMTTSGPLMPFFLPVVAGVGAARPGRGGRILRARPAARRRARGPLVPLPRRPQASRPSTTWASSRACCCRSSSGGWSPPARSTRCFSAGRRRPRSRIPGDGLHDAARLGADRRAARSSARSSAGSSWRSASPRCRCWSIATSAPPRPSRPPGARRTPTRAR